MQSSVGKQEVQKGTCRDLVLFQFYSGMSFGYHREGGGEENVG